MEENLALKSSPRMGHFVQQQGGEEPFSAFIPAPLPPTPPIATESIERWLGDAGIALGRLDSVGKLIPDAKLFLYMYVRKEAVDSSHIEGTQSTLSDLLLYENEGVPGVPIDDVEEVSHYVAAMEYGLRKIRNDNYPITLNLIREVHAVLMRRGRGSHSAAGEFRRTQNWIGGPRPGKARFVPPPPHEVMPTLDKLEKYIHAEDQTHLLIRAGLIHVQFETIHPFLDGNGRLGRLLITMLLCAGGALHHPLLYLSDYFNRNRGDYYDWLQRVRTDGDWEGWLDFYLYGVYETAKNAEKKATEILSLFTTDRENILRKGARAAAAEIIHNFLKQRAVASIESVVEATNLTWPRANRGMEMLESLGIVKEITGNARGRLYAYSGYIDLLN